jgi:apolipoprotein N-acyltransferase
MVRAANNGISAVIDPVGRVVRSQPLGAEGVRDATVPRGLAPTVYVRIGDYAFAILLVAGAIIIVRRKLFQ